MTIRVLLADDQALLRGTCRILIDSCQDLEVVAEAADGAEAVELTRLHRPDVVLMDLRMPGTDGLTATETICADADLADTRVLVLTTFENDDHVARALRAGASGTRALITQFLATSPPTRTSLALRDLTNRELEVMKLAAQGHSNAEIATALHLSVLTVRTHIQRAMTKLGARDRAQLVVLAYQNRLVTP